MNHRKFCGFEEPLLWLYFTVQVVATLQKFLILYKCLYNLDKHRIQLRHIVTDYQMQNQVCDCLLLIILQHDFIHYI